MDDVQKIDLLGQTIAALVHEKSELRSEIARLRDLLALARVALMHYERRGYQLGIVARDALTALKPEADE